MLLRQIIFQICIICLACDCAHLPIRDDCIDMVVSNAGFESMQSKTVQPLAAAPAPYCPSFPPELLQNTVPSLVVCFPRLCWWE